MQRPQPSRRLPIGAEIVPEGGIHVRVWAPRRRQVTMVLEGGPGSEGKQAAAWELQPETHGYFSSYIPTAASGTLYRFQLDEGKELYPDPASRFQPHGPHGPSQVVDPAAFSWTDRDWTCVRREGQVIYEMHLGTFTAVGTWEAAREQLAELAELGITLLEIMPVAEFAGRFGWGYDGVCLFAPTHLYGTPADARRFVDQAHAVGLGVILDVVYNHLGPDGNYLPQFSEHYFSQRHKTEWGEAINYDGPESGPVRELIIANAGYWVSEFHFDGLRLDATQQIFDDSAEHIVAAVGRRVRDAARGRATFVVAENERQQAYYVRSLDQGGYGLDAMWNDDFHHSTHVALTQRAEAYYSDFRGTPQEFISMIKWGFLYQGQYSAWQKQSRGTPGLDLPAAALVTFLENHDQVANSAYGRRCHQLTSPGKYRAMTALWLLSPGTPLFFQGQEFASSSPFLFFADHHAELAPLVHQGRAKFLSQFPSVASAEMQAVLPVPHHPETFERCRLHFNERTEHAEIYQLHKDLLRLRREDPVFSQPRQRGVDGAVLDHQAFIVRFFGDRGDDRLLLVNLGRDVHLQPVPEPLLAPPEGKSWSVLWSSEHPRYGGGGTPPIATEQIWQIPGASTVVLTSENR